MTVNNYSANELEKMLEWITNSVEEIGYEATYNKLKEVKEINGQEITNPARLFLMSFFKELLKMPIDIPR